MDDKPRKTLRKTFFVSAMYLFRSGAHGTRLPNVYRLMHERPQCPIRACRTAQTEGKYITGDDYSLVFDAGDPRECTLTDIVFAHRVCHGKAHLPQSHVNCAVNAGDGGERGGAVARLPSLHHRAERP